jgi:hypothetical protein
MKEGAFQMSHRGTTAERSAHRKASALFDKSAQRQLESDRRVEEQRLANTQLAAKTERLRALRLERDALLARQAAEEATGETKTAGRKKKASPA